MNWKALKGSASDVIWKYLSALAWEDWRKAREVRVRVVGVPCVTQTWHQPSSGITTSPNYLVEKAFPETVASNPRPIPSKTILISSNLRLQHVISYCEVSQLKLCMRFSCLYCGTGSADLNFPFDPPNDIYWKSQIMVLSLCSVHSIRERSLYWVYNYKYFQLDVGNHFRCS